MTKWDVQRAVRCSELKAPARLIMHTLIAIADAGTAEIPPQHTPSLTELAYETDLDRSTVSRYLNQLDKDKWIGRTRPDPVAARVHGERTRYRVMVPPGFEPRQRHGRRPLAEVVAQDNQVVAQDASPSSTVHPDLGAQDNQASCTVHPSSKTTTDQPPTTSSSAIPPTDEERPDVELICTHLANRIEANGSKRPTITAKWRTEARFLIDRDGKTLDQVLAAIDWCQDDTFWRANILSVPKLRQKYEQLRLQAQRALAMRNAPPGQPPPSRNQQILDAAMERAEALERVMTP